MKADGVDGCPGFGEGGGLGQAKASSTAGDEDYFRGDGELIRKRSSSRLW